MLAVLVLLLRRQVPFDESLTLAASIALQKSQRESVERLAERHRAGQPQSELDYLQCGFPRAIASGLGIPRKAQALIQVLTQLEAEYRWQTL